MKKFLVALLLCAVSAVSVFAFTACDDGDNENGGENNEQQGNGGEQEGEQGNETQEVVTTVTEDEWKAAFNCFLVKMDDYGNGIALPSYQKINFSCYWTDIDSTEDSMWGGEPFTADATIKIDYDKVAAGFDVVDEDGESVVSYYAWKDGDVYYLTGDLMSDGFYYTKEIIDEDEMQENTYFYISYYAGGDNIVGLNLAEYYAQFTYSEEADEYTASLYFERWDADTDVILKFENGKLVYMSVNIKDIDGGNILTTYTYTYGITVNVPEWQLNLEVGETPQDEVIIK